MPSSDSGVCGPVPKEEAGAPVQAPAAGHRLHGYLYSVRGLLVQPAGLMFECVGSSWKSLSLLC